MTEIYDNNMSFTLTNDCSKYTVNPHVASLSAFDLAVIANTLDGSMCFVDRNRLFQYHADQRKETALRVYAILDRVSVSVMQ